MTFCYVIKYGDISLLWHRIKEVIIIFPASVILKPKYLKTVLKQLYIFDIKAINLLF